MSILTQDIIREKLKKLQRFINIPRFYGPLSTIAFTVLYHLGHLYFGYSITVSWLWLAMIFGSFVGGLRAGLISAAWIVLYSTYVFWNDDPGRVIQVGIASFLAAGIVGSQTQQLRAALEEKIIALDLAQRNQRAADIVDSINGNIRLNMEAIQLLDAVRDGWRGIPEDDRLRMIETARGKMADLATLAKSFHMMAQERGFVMGDEEWRGELGTPGD